MRLTKFLLVATLVVVFAVMVMAVTTEKKGSKNVFPGNVPPHELVGGDPSNCNACVKDCKRSSSMIMCARKCMKECSQKYQIYRPIPHDDDDALAEPALEEKKKKLRWRRWARKDRRRHRPRRSFRCRMCFFHCSRVEDSEKQSKCRDTCKKICSKKRRPALKKEEAEVQSEAAFRIRSRRLRRAVRIGSRIWKAYRGARAIGLLEDDAAPKKRRRLFGKKRRSGRKGKKLPKCGRCFKFCSRFDDKEKQAKCKAACKKFCSKRKKGGKRRRADKVAPESDMIVRKEQAASWADEDTESQPAKPEAEPEPEPAEPAKPSKSGIANLWAWLLRLFGRK